MSTRTYISHDGTELVLPGEPKMTPAKWFGRLGWRHLVGIVACLFAVFPIVYVLSASFNPSGTMMGSNQLFRTFSLDNYDRLMSATNRPYGQWYLNTTGLAIATALITVLFSALASFAFSRQRFLGRRSGLFSLMLIQMFPQLLNVIAHQPGQGLPAARHRVAHCTHVRLSGRCAGREHLPHVWLLQLGAEGAR